MKRQQTNSTGQSGRQPKGRRFASSMMSYGSTAMSCRTAGQIAVNRRSLLGSCCCAGPVRDAHGRRYTLFPRKWYGEKVFGRIRSPKAKKSSSHLATAGGQYADNVL
ncbi:MULTISPECIES: hypothetical protein [Sphingobacterium]|uniref:hypothetical protein n=1 Tax=Sphingobacterium TaxID=28453 RepID=UPI00105062A3|nr:MULTISPECIES: hypothetical protein [Sphingobacterium]MCW2260097.1 hypothetical protein [Sphingobacterium kitahiroshimense]TCR11111.1 hypothetical protein EDF67_104204 [Sphingobacterium sp. JUb78]